MKKANVTIPYDEEKLAALRIYMQRRSADLDAELTAQMNRLYDKFVPASVREFISERYDEDDATPAKRTVRQAAEEK